MAQEHVIPGLQATAKKPQTCGSCKHYRDDNPSAHGQSWCALLDKIIRPVDFKRDDKESLGKFAEAFHGENCDSYNKDVPRREISAALDTALMTVPIRRSKAAPEYNKNKCKTCESCVNFIPREVLNTRIAVGNYGMCSMKGIAIRTDDKAVPAMVAQSCELRSGGLPMSLEDTADLAKFLVPEYSISQLTKIQNDRKSRMSANETGDGLPVDFDPVTHVDSELAPSTEDMAAGIRAWVKIYDPEGTGNFTYLPNFRRDFFSADEQTKIPNTFDDEHPADFVDHQGFVYQIAVLWMVLDETPALWGAAGTGKTELLRHLAWIMQLPFERISIKESTERDDLEGKMVFKDNETVFKYGRITSAWTKPCVICLDEPNTGPSDVWQFLRPLTDNSKQLVVDANDGETLKRGDFTYLGLAMNPAWDVKNQGANTISDADSSRLTHLETTLPDEETEKGILKRRCSFDNFDIPDELLDLVMRIAKELRALSADETLSISWGIRLQIKVTRLLNWFAPQKAYRMASADFMEPEQRATILDVVNAQIGA